MELAAEHCSIGAATPAGEDPQHYLLANTRETQFPFCSQACPYSISFYRDLP